MADRNRSLSLLPWRRARQIRESCERAVEAVEAKGVAQRELLVAIESLNDSIRRTVEHFEVEEPSAIGPDDPDSEGRSSDG